jgi:cellulose synthase/poly-beta-1,6-N-acetylglucosamine synthase-like glycosyltransferase
MALWLLSLSFFGIYALLLALNWEWARRFIQLLKQPPGPPVPDDDLPRALVILSLRGADPFLGRTLECLRAQTYRNYDLRIVIDDETDPAWEIVQRFIEDAGATSIQIRFLRERLSTCSLKLSALVQELRGLDEQYEAVVQIDADAVPHPGWLREMLSPMKDPGVGCVSGLRWYMPASDNWASLIRYCWGGSAMIQMHQFAMPWGGSMAIKRAVFEETGILDRWSQAFADDVSLNDSLQQAGLRLQYVPAVLVNREAVDLRGCFTFIRRQMFSVRLYHAAFAAVAGYAFLIFFTLLTANSVIALTLWRGDYQTAAVGFAGACLYGIGFAALLDWVEHHVRRKILDQNQPLEPRLTRSLLAGAPTIVLYTACVVSAMLIRRIDWRGVSYELTRGGGIRVISDQPYRLLAPAPELAEASVL